MLGIFYPDLYLSHPLIYSKGNILDIIPLYLNILSPKELLLLLLFWPGLTACGILLIPGGSDGQ